LDEGKKERWDEGRKGGRKREDGMKDGRKMERMAVGRRKAGKKERRTVA
jgi:hypothetical protein